MLNFSKKLFAFAGAVTMFTGVSFGQSLNCTTSQAGGTPLGAPSTFIRAEGQTELLPQITIQCSGAAAGLGPATLTVYLAPSISITSSLLTGSSTNTEAIATTSAGNSSPATVSGSSLTFTNIPVDAGTTSITLSNIRVNATGIPTTAGAAPTGITAQGFVSGTGITPGPTNTATVAYVTNGLKPATFGSTAATSDSKIILANGTNNALASSTTGSFGVCGSINNSTGGNANADFYVSIAENFQSAFKIRANEASTFGGADNPTQGTRIKVSFGNVPGGLNIYMPITLTSTTGAPAGVLTAITSEAGAPVTQSAVTTPAQFAALNVFQVPVSSGTGTAIYEMSTDNTSALDNFAAAVYLNAATNAAASQSAALTVQTSFAPVVSAATVPSFAVLSSSSPVLNVASFTQCTTSLLFPFVTNSGGFETGIAIDNTSKDPFGTRNQSGTCTLSFYGNGSTNPTSGPAPNPNEGGTAAFAAGESYAFTLTAALASASSTNPATFQGYMIASCNFQYAHGFAYILYGTGPSSTAMGYLATVLNGRGSTSAEVTYQ